MCDFLKTDWAPINRRAEARAEWQHAGCDMDRHWDYSFFLYFVQTI